MHRKMKFDDELKEIRRRKSDDDDYLSLWLIFRAWKWNEVEVHELPKLLERSRCAQTDRTTGRNKNLNLTWKSQLALFNMF